MHASTVAGSQRVTVRASCTPSSAPTKRHPSAAAALLAGSAALQAALTASPAVAASEAVASLADGSSVTLAVGGGAALAALGAALVFADPQNRRAQQMAETGGDELEAVKNYFNTDGYSRWKKIYGETDDVNKASSWTSARDTRRPWTRCCVGWTRRAAWRG